MFLEVYTDLDPQPKFVATQNAPKKKKKEKKKKYTPAPSTK